MEPIAAFLTGFGDLLAGYIFALNISLVSRYPSILRLYPPFLSLRGTISGILSGRLSTGLHVGSIEPKLFNNTWYFKILLSVQFIFSLLASLFLSLLSLVVGANLFDILLVTMCVLGLSSLTIPLFTSFVAIYSFKRGLNPDVILYPIVSSVADLIVTYFYVSTLMFYKLKFFVLLLLPGLILISLSILFLWFYRDDEEFLGIIKEGALSMMSVSLIVTVTGIFLEKLVPEITPSILSIYPLLLTLVGDAGSIIGSLATTRIILGGFEGFVEYFDEYAVKILRVLLSFLVAVLFYSALSCFITSSDLLSTLIVVLPSSLLSFIMVLILSLGVATITFKLGLDPDTYVIPLESSLADLFMTISLLVFS